MVNQNMTETEESYWTPSVAVREWLENNSGSIIQDNGDGFKYSFFTALMIGMFMAFYYIWKYIFDNCVYVERYHDLN